ncbi:MAG: F0F1 ATP synthase subunit delta [Pseudomonadota bacterium]|nr:F0F1 ATP synthase subunit delta [Pseudomonadota bacterium]MEC9382496.1 F0F1 ATP synthase subunit delta [Pseudomonadota bacterium]MEC9392735.1 F0F1 ATP synthase subunit delta [Pseudomonadota bacterium]MEC9459242.1 F0F1 ATP synthase subunit delta [Pseudomonadota bacterium]MED5437281.1 F0F1 ATP synthase subunit delta [Pseudomonadota bacterium]
MNQSNQDHTTGISGRYAFALFELIQEEKNSKMLDNINDELLTIGEVISQSEEMLKIIRSPLYNAEEQFSAMKSVLEILKISETLTNFIGVLCYNRRLFVLPDVILAYREYLNQFKGQMTAKIVSSVELTKKQIEKIEKILSENFSQKIDVNLEIDDKILGGLIVQIGSKMIDSSLLTRLKLMQSNMNEV